jgi:hypothetical protein
VTTPPGRYPLFVTGASDVCTSVTTVTLTVLTPNKPPTCEWPEGADTGPFIVTVGQPFSAIMMGNDPDSEELTILVQGLPTGASITPDSGGTAPFDVTFEWTPTEADVADAPYEVTITFVDAYGDHSSCGFTISEVNRPPIADCGQAMITVEATSEDGAYVQLDGSLSSDPDDDPLFYTWAVSDASVILDDPSSATPGGTFHIAEAMATLTVVDERGGFDTCDAIVIVQDSTPPSVLCTTDLAALWPPKHKMQTVTLIFEATDAVSDPTSLQVTATVRSDEPDDAEGLGDGATTGDVNGQDGFTAPVDVTGMLIFDPTYGTNGAWIATIDLRAERGGDGNGRNYTIDFEAVDSQGNTGQCSTCVVVPHDRRGGSQ